MGRLNNGRWMADCWTVIEDDEEEGTGWLGWLG